MESNPDFQSKVKNKVLTGQAREIVNSVLEFMQKEADADKPILDIHKVHERVSVATGVSTSTIKRIKQEASRIKEGSETSFSTPNEIRSERKSYIALDEAGRSTLRNIIQEIRDREKEMPTLPRIYAKMWEECGYMGSIESLRKEIHKMGFQFKKRANKRKMVKEEPSEEPSDETSEETSEESDIEENAKTSKETT